MVSGFSLYDKDYKRRVKINPLDEIYLPLPDKKYDIIYVDPPWDYGGKMQYDNTAIKSKNVGFEKNIFISAAEFKYPTLTISQLKELNVKSIAKDDCLLFMWTTGPHMANAILLGEHWGFNYRTVAFVWDKMIHNPGKYTLSQTEFCLVFKMGRIPSPRGAKNIRQLVASKRTNHSAKPFLVIDGITKMFPHQDKIELFARTSHDGWDVWGLETPNSNIEIPTAENIT